MEGKREVKSDVFRMLLEDPELLKNCAVLREYAIFVDYIRQFQKEFPELELQQDIKKAIDRCIEEDVLKDFLQERRAEVLKVTQLDFTFDRWLELEREESWEEGRQKGREEERANTERERQAREQERQAREQAEEQIRLLQEDFRLLQEQLKQYQKKNL